MIKNYIPKSLTDAQLEAIWETYKVKKNLEDNPENMEDRLINVKELVSTKLSRQSRRINELIEV